MVEVMEEVHLTTIKPKNNVLLLAQEISFAKVLACNDKRLRDRGLKRLKKWFMARSQGSEDFTRDDHMRIWKGLFYCMWMSDKPLIQEELAEEISHLIHSFASFKASLLFVETFFASLSVEWFGIDQLRLDKFMMLVRRFIRQSLELVARIGWPEEEAQQITEVYHRTLTSAPMGLSMHIIEVFCEELAKVGKGELSSDTILLFLGMFARVMATLKDGRLISQITRYVFLHLIRQTELGIEHQMKFSAWKEYGFPGGDVDAAEKVDVESDSEMEDDAEEEEDIAEEDARLEGADARAGKVDVVLPPLDFDTEDLLKVLRELRQKNETTTKARKTLIQLITKFEKLAVGKYPLGLHKVVLPSKIDKKKEITKVAKRMCIEERKMMRRDGKKRLKKNAEKNKKATDQKQSLWEVSETNDNDNCNDSECNTSWEVSESASNSKVKPNRSKKRKTEDNSELNPLRKKAKPSCPHHTPSSFSVSEIKESSPATNTPKKTKTKNVFKTTTDSQNTSSEENEITPKQVIGKKPGKKSKKQNENRISKVNQSISPVSKNITEEVSLNSPNLDDKKQNSPGVKATELQLNTSTTGKNNGWGGEWEEPLENNEYEIFIPNKKYVEKRKSLGLPHPTFSFIQKSAEKVTPINRLKKEQTSKSTTPNSQKKVEFNLSANRAQEYKEYKKKVKNGKSDVLFDSSKKPVQGLLKNSTPSPINPFYKKKLNFLRTP